MKTIYKTASFHLFEQASGPRFHLVLADGHILWQGEECLTFRECEKELNKFIRLKGKENEQ